MARTMTRSTIIFTTLCLALAPVAARAAHTVGAAVEVAPGVENTHVQMWPRAAWCEGAGCWLVAWREGATNDLGADIWCARISADGKALDPKGIRVCAAADNQEQPWAASDGKGFLVAWEDFRNGKDYDIYAARVDAEGKVLDPDGFLVAGGAHNQCHPAATFASTSLPSVWQCKNTRGFMVNETYVCSVSVDSPVSGLTVVRLLLRVMGIQMNRAFCPLRTERPMPFHRLKEAAGPTCIPRAAACM